ncbi:hypothetical protein Dip518_001282 [Parelusimicrobium proximum]|uniref:hypothetical protein n=1 Tax=Parelusimicrobium proximum TaxID=3228953 RepID=UPI003D183E72
MTRLIIGFLLIITCAACNLFAAAPSVYEAPDFSTDFYTAVKYSGEDRFIKIKKAVNNYNKTLEILKQSAPRTAEAMEVKTFAGFINKDPNEEWLMALYNAGYTNPVFFRNGYYTASAKHVLTRVEKYGMEHKAAEIIFWRAATEETLTVPAYETLAKALKDIKKIGLEDIRTTKQGGSILERYFNKVFSKSAFAN